MRVLFLFKKVIWNENHDQSILTQPGKHFVSNFEQYIHFMKKFDLVWLYCYGIRLWSYIRQVIGKLYIILKRIQSMQTCVQLLTLNKIHIW